ncbi:MAG TPA: tetratricopeptide repeat protein, partial [Treponemataceae bacterium]|nr:tetratricopeptide repeat protein [Treponemataceae bacterium]
MKKTYCAVIMAFFSTYFFSISAVELYKAGQEHQAKEDWYSAIELYQEALNVNPSYGDVWFALAKCSYATEQYDLVLTYLNAADKYMPNNTDILNLRGFAFIGLGKIEEARVQFLQVLAENPNDIQSRFGLGELDVFFGKFSGAERYYIDALTRQAQNRKALLALALVSDELNKTDAARNYLKQALAYHSGNADVHYYAGYIAARDSEMKKAEGYLRTAILLDGDYDKAYSLLATILYQQGRFQEAIDICDYQISVNRDNSLAWYLQGLSYRQMNEPIKAYNSLSTGLKIAPRDEVMRAALEMIIDESIALEDRRRISLSKYHVQKGEEYYKHFYAEQSRFEYLVALHLYPENIEARLAYANILLHEGYNESYLAQLEFIKSMGAATQKIDDKIEAWQSKLQTTIPKNWGVDTLYLDKNRWNIQMFYADTVELIHAQAQEICARRLVSYMRSIPEITLTASATTGFSDAFRRARTNKQDFFILLKFEETEREIHIIA